MNDNESLGRSIASFLAEHGETVAEYSSRNFAKKIKAALNLRSVNAFDSVESAWNSALKLLDEIERLVDEELA